MARSYRNILVLGDLHIANHRMFSGPYVNGVNQRCRELVESVRHVVQESGCRYVIQLGDFFDNPKPGPAVLDYVATEFSIPGVEWHIIAGNHDRAGLDAPSAIAVLGQIPGFNTYDDIAEVTLAVGNNQQHCVMVPYTSRTAKESFEIAASRIKPDSYVFAHYGLTNNKLLASAPDHMLFEDAAAVFERTDFSYAVVTGHNHTYETQNFGCHDENNFRYLANIGAPHGTSFRDMDVNGEYLRCGHSGRTWHMGHDVLLSSVQSNVYSPSFRKLKQFQVRLDEDRPYPLWRAHQGSTYLRCTPAERELAETLKKAGLVMDYITVPDDDVEVEKGPTSLEMSAVDEREMLVRWAEETNNQNLVHHIEDLMRAVDASG